MLTDRLTSELEAEFGQQLRLLRLRQNIDQRQLAGQAGVALNVVKRLEAGRGATLKSLIKVLRALGRTDWFNALGPSHSTLGLATTRLSTPRSSLSQASSWRPSRCRWPRLGSHSCFRPCPSSRTSAC